MQKGRLSAMCSNGKYLFASSIDGQLLVLSCKEYLIENITY